MSITLQSLSAAVATLTLTCCASTYGPLEGYEQVQPVAGPESPSPTASTYPV